MELGIRVGEKASLVPTVVGAGGGVLTRCAPWVFCNLILSKAVALLAGQQENRAAIACNVDMPRPKKRLRVQAQRISSFIWLGAGGVAQLLSAATRKWKAVILAALQIGPPPN